MHPSHSLNTQHQYLSQKLAKCSSSHLRIHIQNTTCYINFSDHSSEQQNVLFHRKLCYNFYSKTRLGVLSSLKGTPGISYYEERHIMKCWRKIVLMVINPFQEICNELLFIELTLNLRTLLGEFWVLNS